MEKKIKVAIDPGHGGRDSGAVGTLSYEADNTLEFGKTLGEYLESLGFDVVYTRTSNVYISLNERCNIANDANCDLFISVHNNAFSKTSNGTETLVRSQGSKADEIGQILQKALINENKLADRGVKYRKNLAVLNGTIMPAVILELAFISNPKEELLLINNDLQKKWSRALGVALANYYKIDDDVELINVCINGVNDSVLGFNKNDTIYCGIRELGTKLGYKVNWNDEKKLVELDLKK